MSFIEQITHLVKKEFDIELSSEGIATFTYADTPVLIQANEQSRSVNFYAKLAQVSGEQASELALELLSENLALIHSYGVQYAYDPIEKELLLAMNVPEPVLNTEFWVEVFQGFAVAARFFSERLATRLAPPDHEEMLESSALRP